MNADSHVYTTWDELVELEPRLKQLLEAAKRIKDDPDQPAFCANRVFFEELQWELDRLVGRNRRPKHAILSSSEAWDTAHSKVFAPLPSCRNCGCTSL